MSVSTQNGVRPLRVAFDTWMLGSRFRNQGIYVYAQNLLARLAEIGRDGSMEIMPFTHSNAVNDTGRLAASSGINPATSALMASDYVWRFGGACVAASRNRADVMFCPSATTMPLPKLIPVVTTIHDVTPVKMPSHSRRVTYLSRLLFHAASRQSRAVITVSECSRRDLIEIYKLPEDKVSVVYEGYDKSRFNTRPVEELRRKELLARVGIERPFLLHHGTVQPRKNLTRLISAYKLLLSRRADMECDLVLAGPMGWNHDEIIAMARTANQDSRLRVIFTGPLSDDDLAILVKSAVLEVIPSLYEGFCLPMVEAMACGTPTIAANTSCLPEVSGGVLRYFDPLSVEDIACWMQRALEDSELRRELSRAGVERAAIFSWDACARETMNILKASVWN